MNFQPVQVSVPAQTIAALIQACIAVENIIEYASVTPDILEELESIQPELKRFSEIQ